MYSKSSITSKDTQQYWQQIRLKRQKEIRTNLERCQQLCNEHKFIFNRQNVRLKKENFVQKFNRTKIIDEELPIVNDAIDYSNESPSIIDEYSIHNNSQLYKSRMKTYQQCPSVSSVTSNDKRTNRVYEQWPNYTEISRIVGYRIEKPRIISPLPIIESIQPTQKKSRRFIKAVKQVQIINRISSDQSIRLSPPPPPCPKLPTLLCPSSLSYSKHIQTRQWLMKNNFTSSNLPLI